MEVRPEHGTRSISPKEAAALNRPGRAKPPLEPPPDEDFWVFGYGSLMWHPGFPHVEVRRARLHGYHRHFCIYSHVYRGTPDCPGLVLGLDRGGSCQGLAYRVPAAEAREVTAYLHEREMVTEVYSPRWLKLRSDEGALTAMAFIVDPAHEQYTGRLPAERLIELVLQGCGDSGTCLEYLENTVRHLNALGLSDRPLERLLTRVHARLGA